MPCICGGDDDVVMPTRQAYQSVAEEATARTSTRGSVSMMAAGNIRK